MGIFNDLFLGYGKMWILLFGGYGPGQTDIDNQWIHNLLEE